MNMNGWMMAVWMNGWMDDEDDDHDMYSLDDD
jgi:hypothetical protein